MIDNFQHGPVSEGDYGCAASHCFDHDKAKRLWPADRKEQSSRVAEEIGFLEFVNLADELDIRVSGNHRRDDLFPIALIGVIDLSRYLKW
ncbi:hypothetical protein BraRD5C2_39860 [Bradyrhizobium sp. RD5-C2]|nr:hypothetical protein BraRD5C2_39860 [Bradyrhizobium sp. RD5-C2]